MNAKNTINLLIYLTLYLNVSSQELISKEVDSVFYYINRFRLNKSEKLVFNSSLPKELKTNFYWYLNYLKKGDNNSVPFLINKEYTDAKLKVTNHILSGMFQFQENLNNQETFDEINKAIETSIKNNDSILVCESYRKLFFTVFNDEKKIEEYDESEFYKYNKYLHNSFEQKWYQYYYLRYLSQRDKINKTKSFLKLLKDIKGQEEYVFLRARVQQFLGILTMYFDKDYEKSTYYYLNSIENYKKNNIYFTNQYIIENKVNIGINLTRSGKPRDAINFIHRAFKKEISHREPNDFIITHNVFREAFDSINNIDSSYYHLKEMFKYSKKRDSLNINKALTKLKVVNETHKKEKKIAQQKERINITEAKRKQNQNLFYGSLVFLILGGTIGFLSLKNSRKKRLLAEQQQELEKQKNLTLLKEQEINTINAMIDGQEKERVRIAEDLHDNIGSVLATLKLHFENLKLNREKKHFNQEELYSKTEKLIDETYLRVRSIAHAKNAGVIANKGLLVAVKLMAEKISDANKIKIHVLDFGLDKRLENSLEIAVFRIIQELTTNIIKHANATQATINISQFDSNLNIIIEDNGQGFDFSKVQLKNGMGINSIQTRIQHLKGTFDVDSTIGKGTSIIIDIPILNT